MGFKLFLFIFYENYYLKSNIKSNIYIKKIIQFIIDLLTVTYNIN